MTDSLTPPLRRLSEAVTGMVAALSDERRHELATLASLSDDPADLVLTTVYDETRDALDVAWVGATIGTVSRRWLLTGDVPDEFGPDS